MKATITKVYSERVGRDNREYQLVCFHLHNGGSAISYISKGMKNYGKWAPLLQVGNVLNGLIFLPSDKPTIDADKSDPTLVFRPEKQPELF